MLLSNPLKGLSVEKCLSQNTHYEIKNITELVTEHLMKFEKKTDEYFPSLGKDAYIRNPFTANAQMPQTGTGTHEELVKLNMMVLHAMCIVHFITNYFNHNDVVYSR